MTSQNEKKKRNKPNVKPQNQKMTPKKAENEAKAGYSSVNFPG
jgi:hypothetical protein